MLKEIQKYAAIDFEASSLSAFSYPIEVGLSWLEGQNVQTWSSLIRPHPNWNPNDWAPESELVHGIPMSSLLDAPAADAVAKQLRAVIGDRVLVSDAPKFDEQWLDRLLWTNGDGSDRGLVVHDFNKLNSLMFEGMALDMLYEHLKRKRPPHRAGADSARLASAWAVGCSIALRSSLMEVAGEMLSGSQVEERLGIKRQEIDERRNANKLLAVRLGSDWQYPAFQFSDAGMLPGIENILRAHAEIDPWVILDILLAPDDVLGGRTLLQAIQDGDGEAVRRHVAQAFDDGFG